MKRIDQCVSSAAVALVLTLAMGTLTPAAAQDKKVEVSGGYQYSHFSESDCTGSDCSTNVPAGWYAEVAGKVLERVSVLFEVSGAYKTETHSETVQVTPTLTVTATGEAKSKVHTFMGGIRVNAKTANSKITPFVQLLFGGASAKFSGSALASGGGVTVNESFDESHSNGAVQVGGGVNMMASAKVGVRAGFDYRRIFGEPQNFGKVNVIRVALGVVIPFGK